MKNEMLYCSYSGNEPFILLKYGETDQKLAIEIVNGLIGRQFRVSYSGGDTVAVDEANLLAERMLYSELIVFLISEKAQGSLAFRNAIHFALNRKKELFCIYLDDKPLSHGLALQLSGVPGAHLSDDQNTEGLCQSIITNAQFTQRLRGEGARELVDKNRAKRRTLLAITSVLALLIVAAIGVAAYRIHYENTLPGQIERMTQTEYLDLSGEDASLLKLLDGKRVRVLIARDMGLTDVEALRTVHCEELDLSQNPNIVTLEPLLGNESLLVVTVSQDMCAAIGRISGRHSFQILIGE